MSEKNIGVADVKRHFSEVMSRIAQLGEHFIIEKKGKPVAAMVSIKEFEIIKGLMEKGKKKGLLAAIGAWEDFNGLDRTVVDIYRRRKKAKDRKVKGIS